MLLALVAALLAALAVAGYGALARSRRWLAEPTARGAHAAPTPSGAARS